MTNVTKYCYVLGYNISKCSTNWLINVQNLDNAEDLSIFGSLNDKNGIKETETLPPSLAL